MVLINAYAGVVRRRQGTSSRHLRPSRCQRAGTMRGTIHRFDNGSERRIVYREVPGAHAMVEIEDKLDLGSHGISRTRSRSPRSSTLSSLFSGAAAPVRRLAARGQQTLATWVSAGRGCSADGGSAVASSVLAVGSAAAPAATALVPATTAQSLEPTGSGCGVSSGIIPPSHGQFQAMIERSRTSGGDGSSSIRVAFQCGRRRRGQ